MATDETVSYEAGEIDRVLRQADEHPPVHPHLIEHLREKFAIFIPGCDPRNPGGMAEQALLETGYMLGRQAVIDYLSTLVNTAQGSLHQENLADEFPRPKAESPGTDPFRARPSNRR
jgi:hypothetical protein